MRVFQVLVLFLLTMPSFSSQPLINLDSFEWSNRLILINSKSSSTETMQIKLQENTIEIDDRHIIWFILSGGEVSSNYPGKISDEFYQSIQDEWFYRQNSPIEVVLIGKDGGEKSRDQKLNLNSIFGQIDLMPMRQYEMKN